MQLFDSPTPVFSLQNQTQAGIDHNISWCTLTKSDYPTPDCDKSRNNHSSLLRIPSAIALSQASDPWMASRIQSHNCCKYSALFCFLHYLWLILSGLQVLAYFLCQTFTWSFRTHLLSNLSCSKIGRCLWFGKHVYLIFASGSRPYFTCVPFFLWWAQYLLESFSWIAVRLDLVLLIGFDPFLL